MIRFSICWVVLVWTMIGRAEGKFPAGFRFGAATSAFQIEGAWLDDGKALSVWDNLAHMNFTADGRAPDVGADSYHRYKEDIAMLQRGGIKHYRLSISWPRIVPRGRVNALINQAALTHYRTMLKAFNEAGITTYVTLFHGDLPVLQALQDYGFVDRNFTDNFLYYAKACFEQLGDLVAYWFTFNEPWCMAALEEFKENEKGTKVYDIAHNVLLAHAATVKLYRTEFQPKQKGQIGIVLNTDMFYPRRENEGSDKAAAQRFLDFMVGWFADPIFKGDYPAVMRARIGNRLPHFTPEQRELLLHSTDFFGLNHYSSSLCEDGKTPVGNDYWSDLNVMTTYKPEWKRTDMGWAIVPEGMHDILVYLHNKYTRDAGIPILITENGMANHEPTLVEALNDQPRIDFHAAYLQNVERAINDHVNVIAYFVWSLLDNFEWGSGFTKRFGLVRVEAVEPPVRTAKHSLEWYRQFIANNTAI